MASSFVLSHRVIGSSHDWAVEVGNPVHGHDVVADGEDRGVDGVEVGRMGRVGGEVFFGPIAAVEEVSEIAR